jgi:ribosomal protein L29
MGTPYETDIIAWANEQAALLRSGRLWELDIDHLADEIEDVGKSEQRELANRLALLLAHLLKWRYQPGRRGSGWQRTIKEQRRAIAAHIAGTPSLKAALANPTWLEGVWADAVARAVEEMGLDLFPEDCPWTMEQVLSPSFLPD